jgi:hypothetical protein
LLGTRED